MTSPGDAARIDQETLDQIVSLVVDTLRSQLEEMVAALTAETGGVDGARQLTVDDVATRFNVTRSTVYAHWRQWGGYKLGSGTPRRSGSTPPPCPRIVRMWNRQVTVRTPLPALRSRRGREGADAAIWWSTRPASRNR